MKVFSVQSYFSRGGSRRNSKGSTASSSNSSNGNGGGGFGLMMGFSKDDRPFNNNSRQYAADSNNYVVTAPKYNVIQTSHTLQFARGGGGGPGMPAWRGSNPDLRKVLRLWT